MKLSVIIVTWNAAKDIGDCLHSLLRAISPGSEVFVVDNNSSDATVDLVRTHFPAVALVENKHNKGFAAAINQGLRLATGEYLLIINPDTQVEKNAIVNVLSRMHKIKDCGIGACQLRNIDGSIQKSIRRFPTLRSQLLIMLKAQHYAKFLPSLRSYLQSEFDYTREQQVEQPSGAFLLLTRRCYEAVGGMDERFWIWFEEVDLCKRITERGFSIWYFPQGHITHKGGTAFAAASSLTKQRYMQKSMIRYFKKHRGFGAASVIVFAYPFGLFLALLTQLFRMKRKKYDY